MNMRGFILVLLAAGGTALFAGNAEAFVTLPEREHVQTIVRTVEFASIITAVLIGIVVWRISKRDSEKQSRNRAKNKSE